jgi:hypothetical protein
LTERPTFHFISNRAARGLPEGPEFHHWHENCPLIQVFVKEGAERRQGDGPFRPCPNCQVLTDMENAARA